MEWAPNRIWCWDLTHFGRARRVAFAIIDVVSRRWIDTLVSVEETSTQVQVLFDRALIAEGLADLITPERLELAPDDPARPILLACFDNGPQMTSTATRQFLAGLAVAQRLGRPHTPTDVTPDDEHFGRGDAIRQARIEGLRRAHDQRLTYHRRNGHHHPGARP